MRESRVKFRAVPRNHDCLAYSVRGSLAHRELAQDCHLEEHKRPRHQLEQGQQVEVTNSETAVHNWREASQPPSPRKP